MIKSYTKIALRTLLRGRSYSTINIGGLSAGMAVAILLGLWMYDELSYDRNFENYPRIARVMQNQVFDGQKQTWFSQAMQLGPELRNSYGNNFEHVVIGTFPGDHTLAFGEKRITKSGDFWEPEIAEVLTLKMVHGARSGLKDLHSVFLSESTAKALLGDLNPIEQVIKVDNQFDVKVAGVYEDLPDNSSFAGLKIILPFGLIAADLEKQTGWGNSWFQCLIQINESADMMTVSETIKDAKMKKVSDDPNNARFKPELFLHPISRWHLYSEFQDGVSVGGDIKYVWMLGAIASFVLFLACINFMNLSTARSEKRAKEVGIRKSIGSARIQLISQFFAESILVALFSLVISLVVVQFALPWFNEVSGKRIVILWSDPGFWLICTGFAIVTGLIAGSYPALYLSSFQPVKVLKGTFKAGRFSAVPRQVLVVVQFTVSVTLIIGTVVIFRQIQFAQDRPVGYHTDRIISVAIRTNETMKHFNALRDELVKTGTVEEVAASNAQITDTFITNSGFEWRGKDPDMSEELVTMAITQDFGKTVGWQIVRGRDFSRNLATDSSAFILNEAAVKYMGLENPVGEVVKWGANGEWTIIGVAKDMITQSPYSAIKPMIFVVKSARIPFMQYTTLNIKLSPSKNINEALATIEPIFKKFDPPSPFEYKFVDQEFGKKFSNEKRIGQLAFVFTVLAILISCLGLFGLASFVAAQRTKEIGIRKVLGASVLQLWQLLSKDFVILVIVSCTIAIPLSYYLMSSWLTQYEYRIMISWQIFVMASMGALLITLLTVSFQSVKTALMNPVRSLGSE